MAAPEITRSPAPFPAFESASAEYGTDEQPEKNSRLANQETLQKDLQRAIRHYAKARINPREVVTRYRRAWSTLSEQNIAAAFAAQPVGTPADFYHYSYGLPEEEQIDVIDGFKTIFDSFHHYARAVRNHLDNWRVEASDMSDYSAWLASGLDMYAKTGRERDPLEWTLALDITSLKESVARGTISSILSEDRLLQAISRYAASREEPAQQPEGLHRFGHHHGISAEESQSLPDGTTYLEFALQAARESYRMPYRGKRLHGPYKTLFDAALAQLTADLKAISPELEPRHLQPIGYRPLILPPLLQQERQAFDELYAAKPAYFLSITEKQIADESSLVIPAGLLDTPPYVAQGDFQACASNTFLMVLHAITGCAIQEDELNVSFSPPVSTDRLLNIFETDAYTQRFQKPVQTVQFHSMGLGTIAAMACRLKAKSPDRQIYCVTSLASDTSPDKNIWHSVTLNAVTTDSVIVHDGKAWNTVGPNKSIPKAEFIERWNSTYNTGYLAITHA